MATPSGRPKNKVITDPDGRLVLEWDAYFDRNERLLQETLGGSVTSFEGRTGLVVSANGDYTASEVTNVPAGNIAAVTVQAAIDELDAEKQPLDADLTALAALGGTGLVARTAAATYAERTITAPAAGITVSNGDGVAGTPTLSLPSDFIIPTVVTVPNTGLHLLDTNASHDLIVKPGSNITADRTLTVTTGDTDIEIDLTDPGADRILFWDDSASKWRDLTLGTNLSITDTTINAASAGSGITAATVQASTSGTAITFSSLPAAIKRITVMFDGVDLSGSNNFLVQLGDSGGVETTGYNSSSFNRAADLNSTSGFIISRNSESAGPMWGSMIITRITGNTWTSMHAHGEIAGGRSSAGGGSKSLSADLDRVSIVPTGADTFNAGQINIFYEL